MRFSSARVRFSPLILFDTHEFLNRQRVAQTVVHGGDVVHAVVYRLQIIVLRMFSKQRWRYRYAGDLLHLAIRLELQPQHMRAGCCGPMLRSSPRLGSPASRRSGFVPTGKPLTASTKRHGLDGHASISFGLLVILAQRIPFPIIRTKYPSQIAACPSKPRNCRRFPLVPPAWPKMPSTAQYRALAGQLHFQNGLWRNFMKQMVNNLQPLRFALQSPCNRRHLGKQAYRTPILWFSEGANLDDRACRDQGPRVQNTHLRLNDFFRELCLKELKDFRRRLHLTRRPPSCEAPARA